MSQFTLIWDSSPLAGNANAVSQSALYRYRLVGGVFISAGFTPSNPLATNATTADSPILDENKVIQFKVQSVCTAGGPSDNSNGLIEVIEFASIIPTITHTVSTSNLSIDVTGTDITKARFTLRKASDNAIVGSPTTVYTSGTSISSSQSGLTYSTNYYWDIELYATVASIDTISQVFTPYPFTTDTPAVCNPVTAMNVSSQ